MSAGSCENMFVIIIDAFKKQPTQSTLKLPAEKLDRSGLIHYSKLKKTASTTKDTSSHFSLCNSKFQSTTFFFFFYSRERSGAVVEDGGKDNTVITLVRQGIVETLA